MSRAGLIVNPRSGKASGKGTALAAKLAGNPGISLKILERFEQLPSALDAFANDGVTDLFISSGDGTIHAIQTELAERKPFAVLPRLALLPHGTTNMTAADLGFRHRGLEAQVHAIKTLRFTELRERPTLRVANPRGGKPLHGVFLGTGAISVGTLYCQEAVNAKGLSGNWAAFATIAPAVARALFSAPDPGDKKRFDHPYPIAVAADGKEMASGNQLSLMATTLEKLVLGTRPFWGEKTGAIRTTVIPYPLPSVWRWVIPALYGSDSRKGPPGAVSFSAASLAIRTPVYYVIDGEFFDGPEDEPLRVETGPVFTYIRG